MTMTMPEARALAARVAVYLSDVEVQRYRAPIGGGGHWAYRVVGTHPGGLRRWSFDSADEWEAWQAARQGRPA